MKSLFAASILVLMFCFVSFAQSNEIVPCPKVEVSSPTLNTAPGETITFIATIDEESEKKSVKYEWSVLGGDILEGQGTSTIKTQQKDVGESLTATVEVKILPDGCAVTDSETAATWCPLSVTEIDEFSITATQIDKARLNNLAKQSKDNPVAQIYIIEQFKNNTSQKSIERKNQMIIDYLKTQGVDRDWITLLNAFDKEHQTRFILVPAGAQPPTCDDCITVRPE